MHKIYFICVRDQLIGTLTLRKIPVDWGTHLCQDLPLLWTPRCRCHLYWYPGIDWRRSLFHWYPLILVLFCQTERTCPKLLLLCLCRRTIFLWWDLWLHLKRSYPYPGRQWWFHLRFIFRSFWCMQNCRECFWDSDDWCILSCQCHRMRRHLWFSFTW